MDSETFQFKSFQLNDFSNFAFQLSIYTSYQSVQIPVQNLTKYSAAVASKTITYERNEALYLFALVQINRFIFDLEIRENFREQILVLVLSAEQDLRNRILFFDKIENGSNVVVCDEKAFNPDKLRWIKDKVYVFFQG